MVYRVFVEKKDEKFSKAVIAEIAEMIGEKIESLRILLRYDVEGISEEEFKASVINVFSEPPVDNAYIGDFSVDSSYKVFAIGLLEGQYDQRADSAVHTAFDAKGKTARQVRNGLCDKGRRKLG